MSVSGVSGSSFAGINTQGMNITTMFAMLQLEMGEAKKAEATEMINSMKDQNAKLNTARQMLMEARTKVSDCENKKDNYTQQPESKAFNQFRQDNPSIKFVDPNGTNKPDPNDKSFDSSFWEKSKWEMNVKQIETHIESLGVNTQTMMVQLEDCMGKYNTWSQGASKTISDGNQTLQSIMSR